MYTNEVLSHCDRAMFESLQFLLDAARVSSLADCVILFTCKTNRINLMRFGSVWYTSLKIFRQEIPASNEPFNRLQNNITSFGHNATTYSTYSYAILTN